MKLRPLAICAALCALLALYLRAQLTPAHAGGAANPDGLDSVRTPPEDRRDPENTFLTFPEWFLVYSPDEYASFIADRAPSEFPFFGHLGQFWQGYRAMYGATRDDYPFNLGYHVMVVVIGTSTTVEYGVKGAYETIVGRSAEATCRNGMTAEDQLAARVARDYVDFIKVEPWYLFDFITPLKQVWTDTGSWGADPIRKWERKYFLTSEYAAKAVYGWVIKVATRSAYGEESDDTAVVIDRFPEAARRELPDAKVVQEYADGAVLVRLPRYQAFTRHAEALARADVNFLEIAGNRGPILVSALVPTGYDDAGLHVVMKQPILTRPGTERIVFTVAVPELAKTIAELGPSVQVEHVYDY
jgi:hypothetical protein